MADSEPGLEREHKRGSKVVLLEDIPGVPEGTRGKLGRSLGFALKRYRVKFDNETEFMSIAHDMLLPAKEWPKFQADREADRENERNMQAQAKAAAALAPTAVVGSTAPATASPTPAAASPATEGESGDVGGAASDTGGDPRLAKLLERSKSARKESGVASPAPDAASPAADAASPTPAPASPAPAASPQDSGTDSGGTDSSGTDSDGTDSGGTATDGADSDSAGSPAQPAAPAAATADDPQPALDSPMPGVIHSDPPPANIEIHEPEPFVPGPEIDSRNYVTDDRVSELLAKHRKA